MEDLLQVPAEMTKVETMANKSLRIRVDTQENLTDEQRSKIFAMADKIGWMTFSPSRIEPDAVLDLPDVKLEQGEKSPSQRLRAVLYVMWDGTRPTPTFEEFYRQQMERIITRIKDTLA